VEDITTTVPFPSSATYKVIASRSLSPIYADRRTSRNRIYGIKLSANNPDFERIYPTAKRTPAPVIGQITVALMTTAAPVIGTVTVQPITPIAGTISTRGGWVMDSGSIEASQGWATLSIDTSNVNY